MTKKERNELRTAVADYIRSEGCSCCRDSEAHRKSEDTLGRLLHVRKYSDGVGRDFHKFASKKLK